MNSDKEAANGMFEELKEEQVDTRESATKNLSLSLLQTETPDQVLNIFEREYLRQRKEIIYPEELCLIFYFVTKNLSQGGTYDSEEGVKLVQSDLRFTTLLDLLFAKLPELAYDYLVTTVWSLGICVSAFGLQMEADRKLRLLSTLNQHIDSADGVPPTSVSNIPSLAFSLTCFFNQEDMNQLVPDTVAKLSAIYRK